MNIKTITKSKSKTSMSNIANNNKNTKIRKKSPKTIDCNKVFEKYGNLLEASLDSSDITKKNKENKINMDKSNNDSYYDYIIENMCNNINDEDNKENNNKIQKNKIKINNNAEDNFYFTFKQKMNEIKFDENNVKTIDKDYKSNSNKKEEISIYKNKEKLNIFNSYNNKFKKNKLIKGNMTLKNESDENNFKKGNNLSINYKSNKSYNNIQVNLSKEKQKDKKLKKIKFDNQKNTNTRENNIVKEEVNPKFKEKVLLLLNLCRKYANKFNKLFPLCEESLMSDNNPLNHNSFKELKNTIIQYNNMIFNDGITKIFDLDNNKVISYDLKEEEKEYQQKYEELKIKNKILIEQNENLNLEIIEFSNQIKYLKKIENKYNEQTTIINKLKNEIELLKVENENKINIINNLKNNINKNMISIKECNGLYSELNRNIYNENFINEERDNINSKNENNIEIEEYKNNNQEKKILEKENNIDIYQNFNRIKENNKLKEKENSERITNEIEHLDQEIFNLKSKLIKIIQK